MVKFKDHRGGGSGSKWRSLMRETTDRFRRIWSRTDPLPRRGDGDNDRDTQE